MHDLSEADALDITHAVIIAVRRDPDGVAKVVDVAAAGPECRDRLRWAWIAQARASGATEMHVHRLAEGAGERRAIVADLREHHEASPVGARVTGGRQPVRPEPDR